MNRQILTAILYLVSALGFFLVAYARRFLPRELRGWRLRPIWRLRRSYAGHGHLIHQIGGVLALLGVAGVLILQLVKWKHS